MTLCNLRHTERVRGRHAASVPVFGPRWPSAFDLVSSNVDMARLLERNTRRLKFVGDVTTNWLCPANQCAGGTETPHAAHGAPGAECLTSLGRMTCAWKICCAII